MRPAKQKSNAAGQPKCALMTRGAGWATVGSCHVRGLQGWSIDDAGGYPGGSVRQGFIRDVLPRSERSSQLFVGYSIFQPR